jgi:hypothetical protein
MLLLRNISKHAGREGGGGQRRGIAIKMLWNREDWKRDTLGRNNSPSIVLCTCSILPIAHSMQLYYTLFQPQSSTSMQSTTRRYPKSRRKRRLIIHNHDALPTLQTFVLLIPLSKSASFNPLATTLLLLAVSRKLSMFSSTRSLSLAISLPGVGLPSGV